MPRAPTVHETILAAVPGLRAFALALAGNIDRADDLVQETLLRAIARIDSFEPGTNMSAWLLTILRDLFWSDRRQHRRQVENREGAYVRGPKRPGEQQGRMELAEFGAAFAKLPPDQRMALMLVGALDFSYQEAAPICGCAVGTIKSRVNRARLRLAALLSIDTTEAVEDNIRMSAAAAGRG
jgi:RNA polymerase sigma-70 factor (ECF subfamily)